MTPAEGFGAGRSARVWSLRREWARAFSLMLALLLVAAVAAVVGVFGVVDQVDGSARHLRRESAATATLLSALVSHEEIGHKLLSDEPVDRSAFVRQQHQISLQFNGAITLFPPSQGMKATLVEAEQSWEKGLRTYGLWGNQVYSLKGNHAGDNPIFGASSDHTDSLVEGLEGPSLLALDHGLARGADLKWTLVSVLIALFGLAFAVTVYFRRRMNKDLLRPVATMHRGVLRLREGDFLHRIEIARQDELGVLANAFNTMAEALHESHLALTKKATHDVLTGLPNRASLSERLAASFSRHPDRRAAQESVLFVDVDDFKEVNDLLGHEGGDTLLTQLAARLHACVRPQDLVARLGGDEFAIVVVEQGGASTSTEVAERILDALQVPFEIGATQLTVSVSIGLAQRRPDTGDAAELLRRADFAMYMAKGRGKGQYQIFDAQEHEHMVGRTAMKGDLMFAVDSSQLYLDYQPVADLRTGEVVGVEALVRWQHPTLGTLPPAEFIALAEETGNIQSIGCWVLETATQQAAAWRLAMPYCESLWVAVNLSPLQLGHSAGLDAIHRILADPAAQADRVVLEVTETALTDDVEGGIEALHTLKRLGVRVAIDDFGCGFSSLSALARLPIDILKIDRSFVSDHRLGPPSVPMLEGILGLADKLSLSVIAEGIEEPGQLELLRALGCSAGQGYLLGRPRSAASFGALLASGALLEFVQVPSADLNPRMGDLRQVTSDLDTSSPHALGLATPSPHALGVDTDHMT